MAPERILKLLKNDWESWPLWLGDCPDWNQDWTMPRLQAHRGWHQNGIPENSMESLEAAKSAGFQMAEIDVQITKDGIPVVFHDFNLRQQFFINVNISELNYADLSQLGRFPRLRDILETNHRPEFLNIEIKSKNLLKFPVEDSVVDLLQQTQQVDTVLISSFNPWALLRVKYLDRNLTRALLVSDQPEAWNFYYLRKLWTTPLIEPHVLNFRFSMFSQAWIAKIKTHGFLTAAWTVNDLNTAKNFIEAGVESVITDTIVPTSLT